MQENRPIKVLVLSTSLKRRGGVTNYVKLLMQYLDEKKFHVNHFKQGKSSTKWKKIYLPFMIIYQLLKFKHILRKNKPSVVHLNSGIGTTNLIRDLVFLKATKSIGIPVLFFIHGWNKKVFDHFKNNLLFRKFFLNRISMADAIVVLASQFKEKLVNLGIDPKKIYVSSTIVESDRYLPKNKKISAPFKILFCANMKKEKGPYEVLNAAPTVIEKYPQTRFTFVGKGDDLENLKTEVRQMEIEDNIEFTGFISPEEKIKKFMESHIFAFPTAYGEGFPTVILEAMAAGMPVVTTPNAGLADALEDGKQGFIIESMPPEPKEIAEKIIYLIENPKLMKKMSENNLKEAKEKYDVKVISEEIGKIYFELVHNKKIMEIYRNFKNRGN